MGSYKVIQSGHIVEVYQYSMPIVIPDGENDDVRGGRDKEGNDKRKKEYRMSVNHKAREKMRRLINANFNFNDAFITLTFRDHVTDISKANYELKKFFQKMKRRKRDFKHVTVLEFTKKGRIHYHMICNLEYQWSDWSELQKHERDLAEIWGHGFVDIGYMQGNEQFQKIDNMGAYLLKYLSKDHIDERFEGKKRYFWSRNLIQPKVLSGLDAKEILETIQDEIPVFTNSYEIKPYNSEPLYVNEVKYKEYNSKRS